MLHRNIPQKVAMCIARDLYGCVLSLGCPTASDMCDGLNRGGISLCVLRRVVGSQWHMGHLFVFLCCHGAWHVGSQWGSSAWRRQSVRNRRWAASLWTRRSNTYVTSAESDWTHTVDGKIISPRPEISLDFSVSVTIINEFLLFWKQLCYGDDAQ